MREEDGKAEIDHLSEEEQAEREAKLAKLEKEKKELLTSLAGGDFSTLKTKVAYILNLYPPGPQQRHHTINKILGNLSARSL